MKLSLILEGHPILKTPCEPWTGQEDAQELVKEMTRIMFATNGIGLSAPQVGKPYRMFIMGNKDRMYACFNPRIVSTSEETDNDKEGCLSFPGLFMNIKRPKIIQVEYQDINGNVQQHEFTGYAARCFQHELDHLDGVCFVDRSSNLGLKMARERQRKWLKKGIN